MAKKLVRKASQKGGMPKGVKYRTFDKKGNSTNYASAKDAAGYNDTTQGRADMSQGKALFKADANGKVITPSSLTTPTPFTAPKPPAVDPMLGVTDTVNAGLAGATGGTFDTTNKQIVPPPVDNSAQALFQSYLTANDQAFGEMQTAESRLAEQQKMLKPKEKAVNSLTAQLNTITTNRDAEMLKLEGQGRGVTESIIGGQQAQISREAAIQAMPIQAQLAVAQDDLESARSYASQLFQAQSQDAQAKYAYKRELSASIYNFLSEQEKTRVAKIEKDLDRKFSIEQSNRSTLKQLSMQAIDNGQSALAAEIMRANPASETFDADFGGYMSRLRKPMSVSNRDTQVVNGKLIDMQTGEVITDINGRVSIDIQSKLTSADPISTKQVLAELITGNAITPGARGRIAPSLAVLNSVDALANMNVDGKFTGIGIAGASKEWVKGLFNMKNPAATTNEQNINAINLKVQQWASGASLTEQQTKQVKKFTPTTTDSDRTVRTKLNGLYNFMLTQTQSELLSEGINVEFPTVNLFEVYDLYKKASPEQKALIEQTYFKK